MWNKSKYVRNENGKQAKFNVYPVVIKDVDERFKGNMLQLVVEAPDTETVDFGICINNSILTVPSFGNIEVNGSDNNILNVPVNLGIIGEDDSSYKPVSVYKYVLTDCSEVIIFDKGKMHRFIVDFDSCIRDNI